MRAGGSTAVAFAKPDCAASGNDTKKGAAISRIVFLNAALKQLN
jgi:hypothetical protein